MQLAKDVGKSEIELLEEMRTIMRTTDEMVAGWEHRKQILIRERDAIEDELKMLNKKINDQRTYGYNQLKQRACKLSGEIDKRLDN